MKEIWKDIEGYEGFYQVSNLGNIKSLARKIAYVDGRMRSKEEMIMKKSPKGKYGHTSVGLTLNLVKKSYFVHSLVAKAFIPNPDNKPLVLHKIPKSRGGTDAVDNLYWGDAKENAEDRERDKKADKLSLENKVKELEFEVQELKRRLAEAGL